jgi:hypothetical protein
VLGEKVERVRAAVQALLDRGRRERKHLFW